MMLQKEKKRKKKLKLLYIQRIMKNILFVKAILKTKASILDL